MTIIRRAAAVAAALCLVHSTLSTADEAAAEPTDEIVVTATRVPEPVSRALEPVLVIDRAELENSQALDLGDVLRFHAGLDIGRNGGPGQPLSLFIRGANSDQSIVMIDGVRINSGTQALAPLANLAPELFDRIEIVEGPRSTIYGTDAIGGVVNLITRSGGPSGADVMLDYGRYGTGQAALDGRYAGGGTTLEAAFTGQQSAGFPPFAGDDLDRGYKNLSGTAAITQRFDSLELGARFWQASGTSQYANQVYNGDFTLVTGYAPVDERFLDRLLAAHVGGDLSGIWHALLTVSRVVDDVRQDQVPDFDHTARDTVDLQNDLRLTGQSLDQHLTFGAILVDEHTDSLSFGTGYQIDTHLETYYAQDQLTLGANRLLLAAGESHHPAFGDHATWNAEYGYQLAEDTLLIVSGGSAFRAPSATDRFGFGGTPDLKPESSRNFEVGVKSRVAAGQEVSLSAFQNSIDELIVFVNDPTNLLYGGENRNIDRARIRGVEASWAFKSDAWDARAEASVQDPRDLGTDSQLLRRTRHSFTLSAARHIDRAEIGLDLLDSGPRPDVDVLTFGPIHDGGYVLAALRGQFDLTPAWMVAARLDNALDRRYQLADGYNTAGRAASISTRYRFR